MGYMFASLCNAEPKFELPKQNIFISILMILYFYLWILFGSIFVIAKWVINIVLFSTIFFKITLNTFAQSIA